MVEDRLDDVFPAKELGMRTVWLKKEFCGMQQPASEAYRADFEIGSSENWRRSSLKLFPLRKYQ